MSDTQDNGTPATAPSEPVVASDDAAAPAAPAAPSSSLGAPFSARHLGTTWQVVAALAVVVGLLTGIVTLFDRFTATSPPATTPTPLPTTPAIRVDISSAAGAAALVDFAEAHAGGLVDLDLSCFETVASPACIFEGSGLEVEPGGFEQPLLWVFAEAPCFAPLLQQPIDTRDYPSCLGTSVFWIDPRTDGSLVTMSNIQGASTTAIKGPWDLLSLGGGGVFPGNVHAYRLSPHRSQLPAAGPASPGD